MKLPDKLDVLTIHSRLIAETGGSGGLRDEGMLESALAAVENRYRYEQADAVACAATYEGTINRKPFKTVSQQC
jgi:death on curing protein